MTSTTEGVDPDTFIVAVPEPSYGVNEAYRNVIGAAGYFAANNIFSRLVVYDTGSPQVFPDLAIAWEMAPDARSVRFRLHPEARWQDGAPLTSHDVAYTHLTALENRYHAAGFLADVADIETPTKDEVIYRLARPNAGFFAQLGNLVFCHILPKHLYEGTDWATNPHNELAVGSGPFRIIEHDGEHRLLLERWDDYWGPKAGVARVEIRIVQDRDECVRMVADGRAHYIPQDTLTFGRLHLIEGRTHGDLWRKRGPGVAVLGFNYRQAQWQNRDARLAVASAVDRSRLQALADPGWSEPFDHFFPRSVQWAYDDAATAPPHDRDLAARLAISSGLGEPETPVHLVYNTNFAGHAGIAKSVSEDLQAAGIQCRLEGLDSAVWRVQVDGDGDFDLMITGGNMVPDPEITASRFETGGGRNGMRLSDPEADACYAAARATTDRVERGRHYRELQQVWARNVDWVPLFWYAAYYLRSRCFAGWSDQVGFSVPWWHWGRIHRIAPDPVVSETPSSDPAGA